MSAQNQQEVPVEALVSIVGEMTIENRILKIQIAQLSQMVERFRDKESEKVKDDPKK